MRIVTTLLTLSLLATAGIAQAQTAAPGLPYNNTKVPDAREQVPAGILGMWKAEPRAGLSQMRSFSLTADGKVMVSFASVDSAGKQLLGHWSLQPDGVTQAPEYRNDNGSTPIAVITLKKVDDFTFNITNSVGGVQRSTTLYKFSPDYKTFTLTRGPTTPTPNVTVFHKWAVD